MGYYHKVGTPKARGNFCGEHRVHKLINKYLLLCNCINLYFMSFNNVSLSEFVKKYVVFQFIISCSIVKILLIEHTIHYTIHSY